MTTAPAADIDVESYLSSKGYQARRGSGDELNYPCFFECGEPADSRKRKLYVNTATGMYHCKVCLVEGGTYLLQQHFGDDAKVKTLPGQDPFTRKTLLRAAMQTGVTMLNNNDDVLMYLVTNGQTRWGLGRGLSAQTVIDRGLGYVGNGWSLTESLGRNFHREDLRNSGLVYRDGPKADHDFFTEHLLIPYLTRGGPAMIRGRNLDPHAKAKYLNGPGMDHMLFNSDDLDGREDVVITEGEFDCMILKQTLETAGEERVRNFGVVGIAGPGASPQHMRSYLKDVKRVYIALDPDDPGKRAAVKLKEELGTKARIVELPGGEPKCDWTDLITRRGATWRDCMDLIGHASGKRVFSMREAGTAWRNRREQSTGLKTGFRDLDDMLRPGLLPGQVVVFLAKTGVGKTVMLCNLAYYMRNNKVLFISLEMTREEVYERLRRIYLFWNPHHEDGALEENLANIMICDENRLSNSDFKTLIEEFVVETGCRPEVVMIDYLGYFARSQPGNGQYEKVSNAVMQLKAEAKGGDNQDPTKRFTIISPSQVSRVAKEGKPIDLDDARDSGAIEETADFLFSIYRPDDALATEQYLQPSGRLRLDVLKSRHGGKGKSFSLILDNLTLAIVEADGPAARVANDHNRLDWQGKTWNDMRRDQTAPVQHQLALAQ